MTFFDGRFHASLLEQKIKNYLEIKGSSDSVLAIVQVGDNPSSEKYISLKQKLCDRLGIACEVLNIPQNTPDSDVYEQVKTLFAREKVTGGIVQLPLPKKALESVLSVIPMEKDIDLISPLSLEKFYAGDFTKLSPVVRSFEYFLSENKILLKDLKVAVVGNGYLVGKPIAHYLVKSGAVVSVTDSYERGTKLDCDLLVLSAGVANLVLPSDIPTGCSVVDFGSSVMDGKTVGDLDMGGGEDSLSHLGIVSPSPGGMGPLVVRFLVMNFLGI